MAELRHTLRVRYSDCDPQGVLFNANYLTYFDIAMTELWREAIGPYDEAAAADGVEMVVAEATVRYLEPIRFDQQVELRARVQALGTTSMTTAFEIADEAGALAAEGELRHVFVSRANGRKTPIPERLRERLGAYAPDRG